MYLWLVALHLLGLVVFVMCHGVSMFVVFRVRKERSRDVIAALLDLSSRANQAMYIGLLLLAIGGPRGGVEHGQADRAVGRRLVRRPDRDDGRDVRRQVPGSTTRSARRCEGSEKTERIDDEALFARLAASRRPQLLGGGRHRRARDPRLADGPQARLSDGGQALAGRG